MSDPQPKTIDDDKVLYYVHDPMCSWCWGFRPALNELKQNLPPGLALISLVGGLAPDSDEPMPQSQRNDIRDTWRRIQQTIPGTRFNFDFWELNTPRRSTYPACRGVITARLMGVEDDAMTHAIQQAYYLQAKNPSDLDRLVDNATSLGLDGERFRDLLTSAEVEHLLQMELRQARQLGVYSFPSLVLDCGGEFHNITLDYLSAQNMLKQVVGWL